MSASSGPADPDVETLGALDEGRSNSHVCDYRVRAGSGTGQLNLSLGLRGDVPLLVGMRPPPLPGYAALDPRLLAGFKKVRSTAL